MQAKSWLALGAMLAALAGAPHGAAALEDEWKFLLQFRLALDERCEIQYLLNVRETVIGGADTVSGRAVCTDGRAFDFSRLHPLEPFDIRICEIEVC